MPKSCKRHLRFSICGHLTVSHFATNGMYVLTDIEIQVIKGVVRGLSSEGIANELSRKKRVIDDVRRSIKQKLSYRSSTGLLMHALALGFFNEYLNCVPEPRHQLKAGDILTFSEGEFLHSLLSDTPMKEIATFLDSDEARIRHFQKRVFDKWQVESYPDLILKAVHKGYITLVPKRIIGEKSLSEIDKKLVWNAIRSNSTSNKGTLFEYLYDCEYTVGRFEKNTLSYKELNLMRLRILGKSDSEIAQILEIETRTVANYMSRIRRKLGVRTVGELLKKAIRIGVLQIIPETTLTDFNPCQKDILLLIAQSVPLKKIARTLNISLPKLVLCVNQLKVICSVVSDEGLIVQALRKGALSLEAI